MARPRTIYVDKDKMAAAIHRETQSQIAELRTMTESAAGTFGRWQSEAWWELKMLRDEGVRVNFEAFAGECLTTSQRQRHQQGLRELEADGLVLVYGLKATRVKLTDAGLDYLRGAGLLPPEKAQATPDHAEPPT